VSTGCVTAPGAIMAPGDIVVVAGTKPGGHVGGHGFV
jgi:hypothetical protein